MPGSPVAGGAGSTRDARPRRSPSYLPFPGSGATRAQMTAYASALQASLASPTPPERPADPLPRAGPSAEPTAAPAPALKTLASGPPLRHLASLPRRKALRDSPWCRRRLPGLRAWPKVPPGPLSRRWPHQRPGWRLRSSSPARMKSRVETGTRGASRSPARSTTRAAAPYGAKTAPLPGSSASFAGVTPPGPSPLPLWVDAPDGAVSTPLLGRTLVSRSTGDY